MQTEPINNLFDLEPGAWITVGQLDRLRYPGKTKRPVLEPETVDLLQHAFFLAHEKITLGNAVLTLEDLAKGVVKFTLTNGAQDDREMILLLYQFLAEKYGKDHEWRQPLAGSLEAYSSFFGPETEYELYIGPEILTILSAAWSVQLHDNMESVTIPDLIGGLLLDTAGMRAVLSSLPKEAWPDFRAFLSSVIVEKYLYNQERLPLNPEFYQRRIIETFDLATNAPNGRMRALASINNDRVDFGAKIDRDILTDDPLGRAPDALAIAELVCHHAAPLPLAIGLFGNWGSGKSTFMAMLEAAIDQTTEWGDQILDEGRPAFVENVVHIRFNAWHYSDGDLWASIGTHIFEELSNQASEQKDWLKYLQLEKLMRRLDEATDIIASSDKTIESDAGHKKQLDDRIDKLRDEIRGKREALRTSARDAIQATLKEDLKKELGGAFRALGLDSAIQDATQIEQQYAEIQSFSGRLSKFGAFLLASPKSSVSLVVVATLLVVLVLVAGGALQTRLTGMPEIKEAVAAIKETLAWLAGISTVMWGYFKTFQSKIKPLLDAHQKIIADETGELGRLEAEHASVAMEIRGLEAKVAKAQEAKAAAIEEQAELEEMRSGLRPRKLFRDYIENRAGGDEYRRHLGLISIISRDFRRMSDLMQQQSRARYEDGLKEADLPSIDRIVLYIDDLDRCPPKVVIQVLEAVHLILAYPLFVVVVGVDPRWLESALHSYHSEQFGEAAHQVSAKNYLEKIFQLPYRLQPPCVDMSEDGTDNEYAKLVASILGRATLLETSSDDDADSDRVENGRRESWDNALPGSAAAEGLITKLTPVRPPADLAARTGDETNVKEVLARITLSESERACLGALGPLIGHSPRLTKRVINLYRIIRARWPAEEEAALLGTDHSMSPLFPALMLALALDASCSDDERETLAHRLDYQHPVGEMFEKMFRGRFEERQDQSPSLNEKLRQTRMALDLMSDVLGHHSDHAINWPESWRAVEAHPLIAPFRFQ
ncbi:P-loop NTPase fold protein [Nisaea sp.]|uniref:P-loop NTPase fold protein n=1 Tax=Nisaea sp. TaxID=2024842 RepID=UPI002B26AFC7|nr:P-loop NTPase fold protein [Nisaea sp.]